MTPHLICKVVQLSDDLALVLVEALRPSRVRGQALHTIGEVHEGVRGNTLLTGAR
jgi:hypothetical protein